MRIPGVILAFADQGLLSATGLAASVAVARSGGPEQLAWYTLAMDYALSAGAIHAALVLQPLTAVVPTLPAQERQRHIATLLATHRWLLLAGIIAGGAALAGLPVLGPLAAGCLVFASGRATTDVLRRSAYVDGQPQLAAVLSMACTLPALVLAGGALLLHWPCPAWTMLAATSLGSLIAGMAAVAGPSAREAWRTVWARHWQYGRWTLASVAVQLATNRIFASALALFVSLQDTALFGGARTLLGLPLAVLLALDGLLIPQASAALASDGPTGLHRVQRRYALSAAAAILPVAGLLMAAPTWLLAQLRLTDAPGSWPIAWWCAAIAVASIADRLVGLAVAARQRPAATFAGFCVCLAATAAILPLTLRSGGPFAGAGGCLGLMLLNTLIMTVVPWLWLQRR